MLPLKPSYKNLTASLSPLFSNYEEITRNIYFFAKIYNRQFYILNTEEKQYKIGRMFEYCLLGICVGAVTDTGVHVC